jgi:hypothetical protein
MNVNLMYDQMEWLVAIASYKRARLLCDKTLALLRRHNIPPEKIHIFLANEEEKQEYLQIIPPEPYHIHVAVLGVAAVRSFVIDFFPVGTQVFSIDDDIKDIVELATDKLRPIEDLHTFVTHGFEEARRQGVRLWGLYPVNNHLFMKETHTTGLVFVIGCCFGIITPGTNVLHCTLDDKDDFQRSLCVYLIDGGVLRFNHVAPVTNYGTTPGGNQVTGTPERAAQAARAFVEAHPDLAKLRKTPRGDDIRLWDSRADKVFGPQALATYTPPRL